MIENIPALTYSGKYVQYEPIKKKLTVARHVIMIFYLPTVVLCLLAGFIVYWIDDFWGSFFLILSLVVVHSYKLVDYKDCAYYIKNAQKRASKDPTPDDFYWYEFGYAVKNPQPGDDRMSFTYFEPMLASINKFKMSSLVMLIFDLLIAAAGAGILIYDLTHKPYNNTRQAIGCMIFWSRWLGLVNIYGDHLL